MNFSLFDSLFDSVFVLSEDKTIRYCNEAGASLLESSVKRLSNKKKIYDFVQFSDEDIFCHEGGNKGKESNLAFTEMDFKLLKKDKEGKVQVSIQSYDGSEDPVWIVIFRDVTLEETLHIKYHAQLKQKEDVIDQLKDAQVELKNYSKNLEKMVGERTLELNKVNASLQAILNSLGQGFVTFDNSGNCGSVYTKSCQTLFGMSPEGKKVSELLDLQGNELEEFELWVQTIFAGLLPFESMVDLGPQFYKETDTCYIPVEFHPIYDEDQKLAEIVMVATDKTKEYSHQLIIEKQKQQGQMMLFMLKDKRNATRYVKSLESAINDCRKLKEIDKDYVYRLFHTIEGESGFLKVESIRLASRVVQDGLLTLNSESTMDDFLKLISGFEKELDSFYSSNGELMHLIGLDGINKKEINESVIINFLSCLSEHKVQNEVVSEYKDQFIYEPVSNLLEKYNDIVSQVSQKLGKKVGQIVFEGDPVRIYSDAYQNLFSNFVHLFRNAIDHGFELPEERISSGKNEQGTIKISLRNNGDNFTISIIDDGAGINAEKVKEKIINNSVTENFDLDNDESVYQAIFMPSLTTKDEVGEFSGRGVGLDAVKSEIESFGGSIKVSSIYGQGTTFCINLPFVDRVGSDFKKPVAA